MGSLCSKSAHALSGRTLADEPVQQGGSGNSAPPPGPNPRTAAVEAAERRRLAVRHLCVKSTAQELICVS